MCFVSLIILSFIFIDFSLSLSHILIDVVCLFIVRVVIVDSWCLLLGGDNLQWVCIVVVIG